MSETNQQKFRKLLGELFMFDQADLDFGIYRILNAKRDEISRFLDNDLLPQVRSTLRELESGDRAAIETELNKAIEQAKGVGVNPETAPRVIELRQQLAATTDLEAIENEVFSALFNFFRRYYSEGDFLSLRRYKEGVYAIPYEGEEVKLHWANADQYYIKTTEYFRDYAFKLSDGRRVHFKLADADTEQNNNKPASGQERRFILREADPISEENGELVIRFEYRPDSEKRKQADLNAQAVKSVLNAPATRNWLAALGAKMPTENNPDRTVLDKRLSDYTARNTFDYFIHKNLGGFLRRELDFFIKNEIMHLDDVESESVPRVEQYLAKVKAVRRIAHKIIDFLTQLENFQKKLWLKKKFIYETQYCLTLDHFFAVEDKDLREWFLQQIAQNTAQASEWCRLYSIHQDQNNLLSVKYSEPPTVAYLQENPYLVVDTRHFSDEFKRRLLASYQDIEDQYDGLCVNSENFHALMLLQDRLRDDLACVYIDPPYNTDATAILYKNNYRHSSWLSMIQDRLSIGLNILGSDFPCAIAIDDYELPRLLELITSTFPDYEKNTIVVNHHPQGSGGHNISRTHEYMVLLTQTGEDLIRGQLKDGSPEIRSFMLSGPSDNKLRHGRPNSFYALLIKDGEIVGIEPPPARDEKYPTDNTANGEKRLYPVGPTAREQVWARAYESAKQLLSEGKLKLSSKGAVKFVVDTEGKRRIPTSNWTDSRYNAGPHGTQLLRDILGNDPLLAFSYPKSIHLVQDAIEMMTYADEQPTILDFFAGSGTTAHAVINLNRDGRNRKYIVVEMGDYFDRILLTRVKKAIYAKEWGDAKPTSRNSGVSHFLKYFRLESFEDTLANLELTRTPEQAMLLNQTPELREDYFIRYILDVESQRSMSLLNIAAFSDPFNYRLKVTNGGEANTARVDLVETFNFLLGLCVRQIDTIRGFCVVQGRSPSGEKVLVIWRNIREKSNADLDEFFLKQGYNTRDMEFDLIYVNGDNNLENLKRPDETWKVRLIEEEFKRLMFDVQDV